MIDTNNLLTISVLQEIKDRINKHHELYDTKVSGELWEQILHKSFVKSNLDSSWKPSSHSIGTDIICENIKISCKSGDLKGKKSSKLVVSSYRTTKYDTLEQKLAFLDTSHEDIIFSLVHHNNKYKIFTYVQPLVSTLNWTEKNGDFSAIDLNTGNQFKLAKKMSSQFWMYLNMNNWNMWGYNIYDL